MRLIASRSKLFTSGATPNRFPVAAASRADLVVLDLEDSVTDVGKAAARDAVAAALRDNMFADRRCGVRINPMDGDLWRDDLSAILTGHVDEIHIPKVEHPDHLTAVVAAMDDVASANNGTPDHFDDLTLVATIETARGFLMLQAIADSTPLIGGLQLGVADLALDTGIELNDTRLGWFRAQITVTAAAIGVPAWDPAHLDHHDLDGFRASATEGRKWGMTGKTCIHPDQIAIANDVFAVTEQQREHARRILAAWDNAAAKGLGAVSLDGQLVDRPVARAARRLLDTA